MLGDNWNRLEFEGELDQPANRLRRPPPYLAANC